MAKDDCKKMSGNNRSSQSLWHEEEEDTKEGLADKLEDSIQCYWFPKSIGWQAWNAIVLISREQEDR